MKSKGKLTLGLTILVFILIISTVFTTNYDKNKNLSNYDLIFKDSLSICSELYNEIKGKIILRLKEEYCDACIRTMLIEINENAKLNNDNFIIITQFKDDYLLNFFRQYTRFKVINYTYNFSPMDTVIKQNVYFLHLQTPQKVSVYEFSKGNSYQEFINEFFK